MRDRWGRSRPLANKRSKSTFGDYSSALGGELFSKEARVVGNNHRLMPGSSGKLRTNGLRYPADSRKVKLVGHNGAPTGCSEVNRHMLKVKNLLNEACGFAHNIVDIYH